MGNEDTAGAFENLVNLTGFSDREQDDEGGEAGSPGAQESKSDRLDAQKLQKELKDSKETIRQLSEQMKDLTNKTGDLDLVKKLKAVFTPSDDEEAEKRRKELLDKHDDDPIAFIKDFVQKEIGEVKEKLHTTNLDIRVKEVTDEIDREYEVNWAQDSDKIIKQLNTFSKEFKQNNPKEATLRAMRLAGIGKKRIKPLPRFESADSMSSPGVSKGRKEEMERSFLGGLQKAKEAATASPIGSLWNSGEGMSARRRRK